MKCYVGISQEYASYLSEQNPNVKVEDFNSIIARLMDCQEYHEMQLDSVVAELNNLEELLEYNDDNPAAKQCIQEEIEYWKTKQSCSNDCNYCIKITNIMVSNDLNAFSCAGPPEMKRLKDFPHNGCKEFGSKDVKEELPPECDPSKFTIINSSDTLPPIPRFAQLNIQGADEVGKICTCSNDGCNNINIVG